MPPALGDAIFETLTAAPVICYVAIMDLDRGPEEFPTDEHTYFRSPEDVYATTLMFLTERFEHLLKTKNDQKLIVVDSRFHKKNRRLQHFFDDLQKAKTPYMKLGRIVENLFLGPSHYSIDLQCADLVVAATLATERGIDLDDGYFKKLRTRFAVHPATGELENVSLKRFPETRPREKHRLF